MVRCMPVSNVVRARLVGGQHGNFRVKCRMGDGPHCARYAWKSKCVGIKLLANNSNLVTYGQVMAALQTKRRGEGVVPTQRQRGVPLCLPY